MKEVVKLALEQGGPAFAEEVDRACEAHGEDRVVMLPSGMVVIVNKSEKTVSPIGCGTCVGVQMGQTDKGEPELGGRPCVSAEKLRVPREGIPPEIYVNLWFCPNCGVPVNKALPRFVQNR